MRQWIKIKTSEGKHIDLGKIQSEENEKRCKFREGDEPFDFLGWVTALSVFLDPDFTWTLQFYFSLPANGTLLCVYVTFSLAPKF